MRIPANRRALPRHGHAIEAANTAASHGAGVLDVLVGNDEPPP